VESIISELRSSKLTMTGIRMYYITRTKRRNSDNEYLAFSVPISTTIIGDINNLIFDSTISRILEKSLTEFNPTGTETGTIEHLPLEFVNNYESIYKSISSTLPESIADLDFKEIWGYCIKILYDEHNPNELLFFKKFAYPKIFSKSLILSLVGGSYNKIDDEIITIDNDVHAFSFDKTMYVLNKSQFEIFFNFSSSYRTIVENSIEMLKELDVIENFEDFALHCINSDTLTRRLVKIINEQRFKTVQRCILHVPTVIEDFALNVKFENNKIVYDESSNISDIITLIKGACVIGALDQERYIAADTKNANNP